MEANKPAVAVQIDGASLSKAKAVVAPPTAPTATPRIGDTQSQILVAPQPIKIEVDSPTDWVAVVLTPLALTIAAGYFAARTNRQQMRSNTANYRHTWQLDLRNALVTYIGAVHQLNLKAALNPRFPLSDEGEALRNQLLSSQATVALMLDTKYQYAEDLNSAMSETSNAMFDVPPDIPATMVGLQKVVSASKVALENAWQDIRRDLRHDAKPKAQPVASRAP